MDRREVLKSFVALPCVDMESQDKFDIIDLIKELTEYIHSNISYKTEELSDISIQTICCMDIGNIYHWNTDILKYKELLKIGVLGHCKMKIAKFRGATEFYIKIPNKSSIRSSHYPLLKKGLELHHRFYDTILEEFYNKK